MLDLNLVKKNVIDIIADTQIFNLNEFSWISSILYRSDGKNGIEQLVPLIMLCEKFNLEKNTLTPFNLYMKKMEIDHAFYACKSLYSKQKSILIGVPQRKKHSKFLAPNLYGFLTPQGIKVEIDTCYGLGYCESRQYFVEKALQSNKDYTHIFFIDDDILIPLNALPVMLSFNENIIGANYMKRTFLKESVCTNIKEDNDFIFCNSEVKFEKDKIELLPVNAMGFGCTLINVNVFKKIQPPYFQFVYDFDEYGKRNNLIIGEDNYFMQKAIVSGFAPKVIPGLIAIHTDLQTGKMFAPDWIVDEKNNTIKKEYVNHYCQFACNPQELYHKDIDTVFQQPIRNN